MFEWQDWKNLPTSFEKKEIQVNHESLKPITRGKL